MAILGRGGRVDGLRRGGEPRGAVGDEGIRRRRSVRGARVGQEVAGLAGGVGTIVARGYVEVK